MEILGRLDSNLITNAIKPVGLRVKALTKYNVFNICVKVMRILSAYKSRNGDYEQFKQVMNASHCLDGIENEVT